MCLGAVSLGGWAALEVFRQAEPLVSEWFAIRQVTLTGARQVTREEVLERLQLNPTETWFSLDASQARGRLTSHPWIQSVSITRVPLHGIVVNVTEREGAAIVKTASQRILVDREGQVLSVGKEIEDPHLPVVHGVDPKGLIEGESQSRRAVQAGIEVAGLLAQAFSGRAEVDAGNPYNVLARVEGLRFQFGSSSFREKWGLYQQVRSALLASTQAEDQVLSGEIDLRYPSKVIVRERG